MPNGRTRSWLMLRRTVSGLFPKHQSLQHLKPAKMGGQKL